MKRLLFLTTLFLLSVFLLFKTDPLLHFNTISGAPPYDPSVKDNVSEGEEESLLRDWKRPDGPAKVALQVGHWKTDEVPDELHRLRGNTGATGGGKSEWEVNYEIAEETKKMLEEKCIVVELLPATVPPHYWADVFVAIHADGNEDPDKSGYKAAVPRRNYTRKAHKLLTLIEESYGQATGLIKDPNVTRNMRGYYAFSWWRYEHAVHPMTASLILETGFLTSPADRQLLIGNPEIAAKGLADGVIQYLQEEKLVS